MSTYQIPPIRRPKRFRLQKNIKTGRPEFVAEYEDGLTAIVTYEEMKARAKRSAEGKGLRG